MAKKPSKYDPHQSYREKDRRIRQIKAGKLKIKGE